MKYQITFKGNDKFKYNYTTKIDCNFHDAAGYALHLLPDIQSTTFEEVRVVSITEIEQ